jgi:DNA-binding LytR/AlgR family response regulator
MSLLKRYNCLIVDDEPPAREVLRRYVEQVPILELKGECGNALQAVAALRQHPIDLLFLDIQMPQISGMDLIETLQQRPKVILTTAFEQYAVQAFDLNVTDYLVKPIRFERFLRAVMKAMPEQDLPPAPVASPTVETAPFLYFRVERKMVKVFLHDILFIESLRDYVKIFTVQGTLITKHGMTALEAMLPGASFLRVHRSFLVSLGKIDSFTQEEIDIRKNVIPIGKLYRQQVLERLTGQG